jgi:hypothetical protein
MLSELIAEANGVSNVIRVTDVPLYEVTAMISR